MNCYSLVKIIIKHYILNGANLEYSFDRLWLEVSTDLGATWTKVDSNAIHQNWYNNTQQKFWTGNSYEGYNNPC